MVSLTISQRTIREEVWNSVRHHLVVYNVWGFVENPLDDHRVVVEIGEGVARWSP